MAGKKHREWPFECKHLRSSSKFGELLSVNKEQTEPRNKLALYSVTSNYQYLIMSTDHSESEIKVCLLTI